jgi:hypothetical protein
MAGFVVTLLSIAVIGAFGLLIGGLWVIFKQGERKKGLLMLGTALVLFLNVLIWSLPPPG